MHKLNSIILLIIITYDICISVFCIPCCNVCIYTFIKGGKYQKSHLDKNKTFDGGRVDGYLVTQYSTPYIRKEKGMKSFKR